MPYLIGTDEAGYGPNLGPLVISASVWQVPKACDENSIEELIAGCIARAIATASADGDPLARSLLVIADSKQLYKPSAGLRLLEQHFLAALAMCARRPTSWLDCWQLLAPDACALFGAAPWYEGFDDPLPWDADCDEIDRLADFTSAALEKVGIRLVTLRARVIFPPEFNELVDEHGSKGEALSEETIGLLATVIGELDRGPIRVVCDKHGGRNHYGRHLQKRFPDTLVEVHGEGRERSVYRWGPRTRRVEVCFQARGEAMLATALASMCSKYLRELAMRPFNHFWRQRVPELRPTAGYPGDSRRFMNDIACARADLKIEDRHLWRER